MSNLDTKLTSNKIQKVIAIIFSIFWVIVVGLDYVNKHPEYLQSLLYFKYPKLLIFIVSTVLILVWHYRFDKVITKKIPVHGLSITLLTLIFSIAISFAHKSYSYTPTSFTQVLYSIKWCWEVIAIIFIIVMILKSMGQYFYRKTLEKHLPQDAILEIALGIILFVFVLFTIGAFGKLMPNSVLAVLFVFSLLNLFDLVKSFKNFFLKPIDVSRFSSIGILAFCFMLFFLVLNFQTSIGPFPTGFDSRNFYVNLSKLIAESGGLVEGYQPYNWSIFMGTGFLLFNKVELALGISYLGVVLVLLASYKLGKDLLKLDSNMLMLVLAVFIVTPAIMNQMTVELKVDFGMLFYQILILYYAIKLLNAIDHLDLNKNGFKQNIKSILPLILIIGIMSGFALGIKLINMFLIFALMILLWWDSENKVAVFGILCFSIALFLLAGVDNLSGLNKYHLSSQYLKYGLTIIALLALGYSFYKFKKRTLLRFVVTTLFLFFSGVMLVPWMVKNYSEMKSFGSHSIIMGKEPGPNLTLIQMIKKYERSKKK